ncbi:MAG: alpha/beta hydrolase [Rhodospirillaceae bacterium]|jgi:acetyl esterase|nr:alpha/beta hydrolase [Rhodospirillaceae bacterium]
MKIHPQAQIVIDMLSSDGVNILSQMTVPEARAHYDKVILENNLDLAEVGAVEDREIDGIHGPIPIRIIWPFGADKATPLPVFVFLHGGGWVIGSVASREPQLRQIANRANCIVVAVSYRLAPENKFPAALDDSIAAIRWTADNADELGSDTSRLAIGGDSSGGNMAIVAALDFRDNGGPDICYQLLIYPPTDPMLTRDFPSYKLFDGGYVLTRKQGDWYKECYLPDDFDPTDVRYSPILADDFSGLPPALIITAECDPLCDAGANFANLLQQAGVVVDYQCYEGMIHTFWHWGKLIDAANIALDKCIEGLNDAFAK